MQQLLYTWIVRIIIGVLIYFFVKTCGKAFQKWFFAVFWNSVMVGYHDALKHMKGEHFGSMKDHKSADSELRKQGVLRILEIGAGSGGNFELFPANSRLTVVEPNTHFESMFYERQSKHPTLKLEKFLVANAEDMKEIEDNSFDIVVSTLVLCSVDSIENVLKEVHRVLAPGGKYYYWEHVHDMPGTLLHTLQTILTPIWAVGADNCRLNRNIDAIVAKEKGFAKVDQKRFDIPYGKGLFWLIRVHVMGVATK